MNRPIRVGVIGCGQFMSRQHIQTIGRSDLLTLHRLADRNERALAEVARHYAPSHVGTEWMEVVEDDEVDVVVAGIVPELHPEIARAALQNRKPVYIEKPLTDDLEVGRQIARLASEVGKPVAVGFNRRFAPAVRWIDAIMRVTPGPCTMLYRICDDSRVRPPEQDWKNQDRLLLETVHIFDLLSYLTRSEPERIHAIESRSNDALVTIRFRDGSQASIVSSSMGSLSQPKEHLEAVLNRSAVEMDDFVEARSYGDPRFPAVARFAGRMYDRCDNQHVDDFAKRGLRAMIELRERYYRAMLDSGVLEDSSDEDAWVRARTLLGSPPIPQINYTPDKGWGSALEEFCLRASEGASPENADTVAGNRASACALAARRSIETGAPVDLDPDLWR